MIRRFLFTFFAFSLLTSHLMAQDFADTFGSPKSSEVTASFLSSVKRIHPKQPFYLGIKLEVPEGYHTFYQAAGGVGKPTKVAIHGPQGFEIGAVQFPNPELEVTKLPKSDGTKLVQVSYVYGHTTTIFAKVTPLQSAPTKEVEFTADVSFQYCKNGGSCFSPKPERLKLKLPMGRKTDAASPSDDADAFQESLKNLPSPGDTSDAVRVHASLSTTQIARGDKGELLVAVKVNPGWFLAQNQPNVEKAESTEVIVHDMPGLKFAAPIYPPPINKPEFIESFLSLNGYGNGKLFVIRVPFTATNEFIGGEKTITGVLRCQPLGLASDQLPVQHLAFSAFLPNTSLTEANGTANPTPTSNSSQAMPPTDASTMEVVKSAGEIEFEIDHGPKMSVAMYLLFAFLGGLVLNVMPCVLPVIAIKILSFVQHAGENRRRIFLLNVSYALGVIAVFLMLATLAATASIGWGQLFQRAEFNLVMAAVVFAMGLSLLGVYEIPIPGLAGAGSHQEGLLGAFMTGILATLLATPCSGPFFGVALSWSLQQPVTVTFLVWAMMGLGMASPYLVLGAFPALIRWLPKPGAWMVTFKEFTGLILMATVIYLMTLVEYAYVVPALAMLVGIAAALWMIGSLYTFDSPLKRKWTIRLTALMVGVATVYVAFVPLRAWSMSVAQRRLDLELQKLQSSRPGPLKPAAEQVKNNGAIEFEPDSDARLNQLIGEGKTILIDFTAEWCPTCHLVEAAAINTWETEALFEEYGMAAMVADRTNEIPELENALKRFGGSAIPYLVIIPGERPTKPIILKDFYSKTDLLDKLREAGPSKKK